MPRTDWDLLSAFTTAYSRVNVHLFGSTGFPNIAMLYDKSGSTGACVYVDPFMPLPDDEVERLQKRWAEPLAARLRTPASQVPLVVNGKRVLDNIPCYMRELWHPFKAMFDIDRGSHLGPDSPLVLDVNPWAALLDDATCAFLRDTLVPELLARDTYAPIPLATDAQVVALWRIVQACAADDEPLIARAWAGTLAYYRANKDTAVLPEDALIGTTPTIIRAWMNDEDVPDPLDRTSFSALLMFAHGMPLNELLKTKDVLERDYDYARYRVEGTYDAATLLTHEFALWAEEQLMAAFAREYVRQYDSLPKDSLDENADVVDTQVWKDYVRTVLENQWNCLPSVFAKMYATNDEEEALRVKWEEEAGAFSRPPRVPMRSLAEYNKDVVDTRRVDLLGWFPSLKTIYKQFSVLLATKKA